MKKSLVRITRDRIDRTANFYNYKPQSPNSRYHAGTDNL